MKTINFSFFTTLCLFVMLFCLTNCSTETKEEKAADEISDAMNELQDELKKAGNDVDGSVSDAMDKVGDAMEQLKKEGKVVEPVNFRILKEGIPETFMGMERTKNEGETAGAMGFKVSTAKATFKEGDKKVDIEIIDVGGLGMAAMGMAAWAMAEIDKESEDGFERTTTFEGHKAFEKCNGTRCEFSSWMSQRIIFNIKSNNVGIDEMKKGLKKDVDLDALMRKVAAETK